MLRAGALLAVLLFLVLLLGSTVKAFVEQRGEIAATEQQITTQQREVAALQREMGRWDDPAYIERLARERLKFVRPGERSYTVIEGSRDESGTGRYTLALRTTVVPKPWYASVWESITVADAAQPSRP